MAQIERRDFLAWLGASAAVGLVTACDGAPTTAARAEAKSAAKSGAKVFPVAFSDAEWRKRLTPAQYRILRQSGTEQPGSSPLNKERRKGTYVCAGDNSPLFSATTKFDSGTGWPSFWKPLPGAIGTKIDRDMLVERIEVHCAKCGGHLGHVFSDGPKPTGLRYCMNGDAMLFVPAKA